MDAAYKEVSNYQDLLLLGDLATITQEKRPYSWISSACAGADDGRERELEGGRQGLQDGQWTRHEFLDVVGGRLYLTIN